MAYKFASEQPAGFNNYIEKVAIVGVSHGIIFLASDSMTQYKLKLQTGGRPNREIHHRRAAQSWKA